MKIIGLTSKAGGGKGTAAMLITQYLTSQGKTITPLSFANILKDACAIIFDWDRMMLEGDTEESRKLREVVDPYWSDKFKIPDFTPRLALQLMGTEAMRQGFHQNIWIYVLERAILHGKFKNFDYGIISDCRFLNELEFVRSMGGILIKIKRDNNKEISDLYTSHASETEWEQWNDWDHVIINRIDDNISMDENLNIFKNKLVSVLL